MSNIIHVFSGNDAPMVVRPDLVGPDKASRPRATDLEAGTMYVAADVGEACVVVDSDWSTWFLFRGEPGPKGADGVPGTPGMSAYEIAVAGGFVGSEAEWLASLQGEPGAPGVDGNDGAPWMLLNSTVSVSAGVTPLILPPTGLDALLVARVTTPAPDAACTFRIDGETIDAAVDETASIDPTTVGSALTRSFQVAPGSYDVVVDGSLVLDVEVYSGQQT